MSFDSKKENRIKLKMSVEYENYGYTNIVSALRAIKKNTNIVFYELDGNPIEMVEAKAVYKANKDLLDPDILRNNSKKLIEINNNPHIDETVKYENNKKLKLYKYIYDEIHRDEPNIEKNEIK